MKVWSLLVLLVVACAAPSEPPANVTAVAAPAAKGEERGTADFFAASESEMRSLDVAAGPDGLPSVVGARVDAVKLIQLQCLIDGSSFEQASRSIDKLYLREASPDGPWILHVPSVVVDSLVSADEADLRALAARWAGTEEWQADGGTPENLTPWFLEVAEVARAGRARGRQLYLWQSL